MTPREAGPQSDHDDGHATPDGPAGRDAAGEHASHGCSNRGDTREQSCCATTQRADRRIPTDEGDGGQTYSEVADRSPLRNAKCLSVNSGRLIVYEAS